MKLTNRKIMLSNIFIKNHRTQRDKQVIVQATALDKIIALGDKPLIILQDINLQVDAGESVAIVGASGSGKSTLLGLLAGLDVPTSGQVFLDNEAIFLLDEDQRAALRSRLLGFMFQSFQLLPALTAMENVMLPVELSGQKSAKQLAQALLERVGLGARLDHYPRQLSGGEQQRVAIARAFVTQPKLLFADEPTGNLDSETGKQIIELMFELNQEKGTTLILVTHDEALSNRCDRKIKMVSGRIID